MKIDNIRVFVPTKDYEQSKSFYQALGFLVEPASNDLSVCTNGTCTFFLQRFYNSEFANNFMLQLIVPDIKQAYQTVSNLSGFDIKFDPIKNEPWGKVIYLWGPAGELLHITELLN